MSNKLFSSSTTQINKSKFTIVSNGFADGPSQALRDYLNKSKAFKVTVISHPLVPESSGRHSVITYGENKVIEKEIHLVNKPPFTYIFDPFIPLRISKDDVWFGFNNLSVLRGLLRRKFGRSKKVVYWAVDFVPNRFGKGILTKCYDSVDRFVCKRVDLRIDLSEAALHARTKHLGLTDSLGNTKVVPMGAWLNDTPKITEKNWSKKKIVYLGHIVERQGVETLVYAMNELIKIDPTITADIIGSGPLLEELISLTKQLNLVNHIKFHGFVKDHKEVERILSLATIAVAPYKKDKDSFTQFADPGKLKAYLGAHLPICLTDVPPNAKELEEYAGAIIVNDSYKEIAKSIHKLLEDKNDWLQRHRSAKEYSFRFDWQVIIKDMMATINFK